MVETSTEGCKDPNGGGGEAASEAEDDVSLGSTRSSDSSPDEDMDDSDPEANTEKCVYSFKARCTNGLTVASKAR